jgi:hypothetical protein
LTVDVCKYSAHEIHVPPLDAPLSSHRYLSFLVMGIIIVPAVIAIVMILEAMARAEKYTEVFMKTESGEYEARGGVDLEDRDRAADNHRLRVKKKKFEIVEVS